VVLGLTFVQAATTLYLVAGGGLYQDDIRAIVLISGLPFHEALLWTNHTHVVPGTHAILWLHGRLFGLAYWPAIVVIITLRMAAAASIWWMLREFFGRRWSTVALFGIAVLMPVSIPATAWYAQALTLLPVQIAVAVGVTCLHRYARSERPVWAFGVAASLAIGLCFAEKSIVLVVFLPSLWLLYLHRPSSLAGVISSLRRGLPVWTGIAAVSTAWLLTYSSSGGMTGRPYTPSQALHIATDHFWSGFLPEFVGGPWTWRLKGIFYEDSPYYGVAAAPLFTCIAGAFVLALLLVLGVRHRPRPLAVGLLVLTSYYVPCFVLVTLARGGMLSEQLGVDLRFWADAVPALVLAAGIALDSGRRPPSHGIRMRATACLCLVGLAWMGSSFVSVWGFARGWHQNRSGAFISALATDLQEVDSSSGIYEVELPRRIISAQFGIETSSALLVAWLAPQTHVGLVQNRTYLIDSSGRLRPATWSASSGVVGASGLCPEGRSGGIAQLAREVGAERNLSVRFTTVAPRGGSMSIQMRSGGEWWNIERQNSVHLQRTFPLPPGRATQAHLLPAGLPVSAVRFTAKGAGPICVSQISVGRPQ
jgi:hypothetical protein